jgi:hypothetical protein
MIFESLDCLFGYVATMTVGWNELMGHPCIFYAHFEFFQELVV